MIHPEAMIGIFLKLVCLFKFARNLLLPSKYKEKRSKNVSKIILMYMIVKKNNRISQLNILKRGFNFADSKVAREM